MEVNLWVLKMNRGVLIFGDKGVCRIWHNDDWFFSIVDFVGQLKMMLSDGKNYMTDCEKKGYVSEKDKFMGGLMNRNVFKLNVLGSFEIFPSDPFGSLDDFYSEIFIDLGGNFYE